MRKLSGANCAHRGATGAFGDLRDRIDQLAHLLARRVGADAKFVELGLASVTRGGGGGPGAFVQSAPDRTEQILFLPGAWQQCPQHGTDGETADERADQVFATRVGLREGRDELRAGMAAFIKVPK